MLVTIGRRAPKEDLFDLLLECHQRIRLFARLAADLGQREGLDQASVVEAAQRCERYFTLALPLHVEDEERSLLPRLQGKRPDVDAALASMHAQHEAHGPQLAALLASLRAVREQPLDVALRATLGAVASALVDDFDQHLTLEEQVLFPAARELLARPEQEAVLAELRARRQGPLPPSAFQT